MPETSSLRPEDIKVETFAPLTPEFHVVDEDPADPASGHDVVVPNGRGHFTHM